MPRCAIPTSGWVSQHRGMHISWLHDTQIRHSWPVQCYLPPIVICTIVYNLPRFWELRVSEAKPSSNMPWYDSSSKIGVPDESYYNALVDLNMTSINIEEVSMSLKYCQTPASPRLGPSPNVWYIVFEIYELLTFCRARRFIWDNFYFKWDISSALDRTWTCDYYSAYRTYIKPCMQTTSKLSHFCCANYN